MKKKKIGTALALTVLLTSTMSTLAFASSRYMSNGGSAYLNSEYSNGMKCVEAGTVPGVGGHYSSVWLETAYEDGSITQEQDGPKRGVTSLNHEWEWALDYSSIHSLLYSPTNLYDRCSLGG